MRLLNLFAGSAIYLLFLASFLYLIGFLAGMGVPWHVDGGGPLDNLARAFAVDLGLLLLFGLQHSLMARPAFKRLWLRLVPASLERSFYVLSTVVVLVLIFWLWRPLPEQLWSIKSAWLSGSVWGLFVCGWILILYSTFLINHFELFGLQQVWRHFLKREVKSAEFREPGLYRWVRHPLYVGWLAVFWATPTMTVGHLLFALTMTCYILVAIRFEEKDLKAIHPEYAAYAQRVPMLIPAINARSANESVAVETT